MTYASYTRQSGERLKAIAHGPRYRQATAIVAPRPGDVILDYGCADGHLFTYLKSHAPGRMVGYDPSAELLAQMAPDVRSAVTVYDDRSALRDECAGAFSLIICIEVCEHLTATALDELFDTLLAVARSDARFVFGVPIETGPSGFLKTLYRCLRGGRQGATPAAALRALVGLPIARTPSDLEWYGSHIGFDDRAFRRRLEARGLMVRRIDFAPFALARRLLNNEVYYSCVRTPPHA
jgi:hypothetical protein